MPEIAIRLYGFRPSFDAKAGPLTGLVEVEGGTSGYLVDRERERCRIAGFPGNERDKWTSPVGVLLAARRGWWGLSIRLDLIPCPPMPNPGLEIEIGRDFRRPHLPGELASCLRCGCLVVVERARQGKAIRIVNPTRRLARSARHVMARFEPDFDSRWSGRGEQARVDHDYDCYALPGFFGFTSPKPKRKGGRPRVEKPPKVPLPYTINRDWKRKAGV